MCCPNQIIILIMPSSRQLERNRQFSRVKLTAIPLQSCKLCHRKGIQCLGDLTQSKRCLSCIQGGRSCCDAASLQQFSIQDHKSAKLLSEQEEVESSIQDTIRQMGELSQHLTTLIATRNSLQQMQQSTLQQAVQAVAEDFENECVEAPASFSSSQETVFSGVYIHDDEVLTDSQFDEIFEALVAEPGWEIPALGGAEGIVLGGLGN